MAEVGGLKTLERLGFPVTKEEQVRAGFQRGLLVDVHAGYVHGSHFGSMLDLINERTVRDLRQILTTMSKYRSAGQTIIINKVRLLINEDGSVVFGHPVDELDLRLRAAGDVRVVSTRFMSETDRSLFEDSYRELNRVYKAAVRITTGEEPLDWSMAREPAPLVPIPIPPYSQRQHTD